jgi:hypothetical protein
MSLGREMVVHAKKEEEEEINMRHDENKSFYANHK